jgi:hypothetical protein
MLGEWHKAWLSFRLHDAAALLLFKEFWAPFAWRLLAMDLYKTFNE